MFFQREIPELDVKKFKFNNADLAILNSFLIFPYLTVEQVCALHYSKGSLTYLKIRLPWLVSEGYLHRVERPAQIYPYLYTIALRGTRQLQEKPIFYPREHKLVHMMHYRHLLLTNEVLIASLKLPQVLSDSTLYDIRHDLTLKKQFKGVVGDGWIDVRIKNEHIPLWFEIHVGSKSDEPMKKDKEKFQTKIEGILDSVRGEYQQVFHTDLVTVSFLTPYDWKVPLLVDWAQERLERLGEEREADLFRFAHIPERNIDPIELFTKPMHQWPFSHGAVTSLI